MHVCAAAATETKEETFTYQAEVSIPEHILSDCVVNRRSMLDVSHKVFCSKLLC